MAKHIDFFYMACTKSHLSVCILSEESVMPPKWKLISTYYFTIWKGNPVMNNVERLYTFLFSIAADKNSYLVKTTNMSML